MENKYRISFTVGLGKTKYGKEIEGLEMKLRHARNWLAELYSGYTEIRHQGGWDDGLGVLIEELGVTWQVVTQLENYSTMAVLLRNLFEQSCVMVVKESVEVEFV